MCAVVSRLPETVVGARLVKMFESHQVAEPALNVTVPLKAPPPCWISLLKLTEQYPLTPWEGTQEVHERPVRVLWFVLVVAVSERSSIHNFSCPTPGKLKLASAVVRS